MRRLLLIGALLLFTVATVGTTLTEVRPGERAVIRRWGRILPDRPGPGLHIGLPWGIDRVERVPVGIVRRVVVGFRDELSEENTTPPGQLLTGDHNLVNVQAEIDYRVREEQVDLFALHVDRADGLVARIAESVLAEWVAGRGVDDVLIRGKAMLPITLVHEANRRLDAFGLGVEVEQASLTRLNPPEEVKDAFEQVAQAQTGIATKINQAEQGAERQRRDAEAEVFRLKRATAAYVQEQKLLALADANDFLRRLAQYRNLSRDHADYLNVLWEDEVTRLYVQLKESGRVDLLDHHLTGDGLNITQFPLVGPRKK